MNQKVEQAYEELRAIIDGGSENMTHKQAVELVRQWAESAWIPYKQPAPVTDLSSANRELYFAAYAMADSICEDHPSLADVFDTDSHGRLCSALAALDDHYGVTSPEVRRSLDARPAPEELSPEFSDTASAALLWVLWHHQGGSSPVGQPIRFALGMGAHDRLDERQIAEAKRWAATTGSTTAEFYKAAQPAQSLKPTVGRTCHE